MRRAVVIMVAMVAALFVAPMQALAADGSYSIDELSTEITVQTDATAHIVERQTLTFENRNMGVTWYLHVPESGESVRISSVRVAPVDDGGTLLGDWTRLQMIDSKPSQQGRNPGDYAQLALRTAKTQPWYSYNIGDGMMRSYFPTGNSALIANAANASDEDANANVQAEAADFHTYVIETDYTVAHRVRVFRDVAELYWRYVNDSLPAGPRNASLQVNLPLPADADPAEASAQIRAWGHGPDKGTFTIGSDGSVTYRIDQVDRGHYAEAHVIFPAVWMSNVAPNSPNIFSELRGPAAIDEESEWVDVGLREAAWDNKVRVMFLVFALLVIAIGAIGVIRHGRSPQSRRALVRVAATLAITAAGAQVFFREPLTTVLLAALAVVVALVSLALPANEEEALELELAEGVHEEGGAVGADGADGADGAVGAVVVAGEYGAVGAVGADGEGVAAGEEEADGEEEAAGAVGAVVVAGEYGAVGADGEEGAES